MAVLVATTYRFSSAFKDSDQLDNAFSLSLWNAIIVALLSVFPALILQCTSGNTLRRKGLRLILWILVVFFTITSSILFFIWYRSLNPYALPRTKAGSYQYLWNLCTEDLPRRIRQNLGFVIAAQSQLFLNFTFWTSTKISISGIVQKGKTFERERSVDQTQARCTDAHRSPNRVSAFQLRILQVFSAQLMMWLLLGLLTSLTLSDDVTAGDSFENLKWSVGQILGLAQFVPVVIDLFVASICEYSCLNHSEIPVTNTL